MIINKRAVAKSIPFFLAISSIVLVFVFIFALTFVFALHTVTPVNINVTEDITYLFNISINNTDSGEANNITEVNITLPSSFLFTPADSNGTSSLSVFSNTSNILSWVNTTTVVNSNGSVNYFWFNATASTPGTYNITVSTLNISGVRTFNVSVFVNDTTAPSAITFVSPSETDAANVSRNNVEINVTATDNGALDSILIRLYLSNHTLRNSSRSSTSPGFINITSLSDGLYYFNATVNDTSNNVNNTATRAVKVDTTLPLVSFGVNSEGDGNNQTRANIYVNASVTETNEDSITFLLHNATARVNSTTLTSKAREINWTVLADGIYTFNITVNDSAGNTNTSVSRTVKIDNAGPQTVTFVSPTETDAANVSRTSLEVNVTAADNVTKIDSIVIYLFLSNHTLANSSKSSNIPASAYVNFSGGLTDGLYYINATANDTVGNTNSTATRAVKIDTTKPLVSFGVNSEGDGNNQTRANIYVNASVTETNEDSITFLLHNATARVNTTTLTSKGRTINWTGLADGTYRFNVTVNDSAGNTNTSVTRIVVVDSAAPSAVTFVSPSETDAANFSRTNIQINVTATDTGSLSSILIRLYLSNHTLRNSSISATSPNFINITGLSDGLYFFNATVNDTSNNVNNTATRAVKVDTTRPLVSFGVNSESDNSNISRTNIYVNASVTETNEDSITFTLHNATALINRTSFTNKARTINWTGLVNGTYTFNITVNDSAGNTNTSVNRNVTVDNGRPSVTLSSSASTTQTSLVVGITVVDRGNSGINGTCTSNVTGTFVGTGSSQTFTRAGLTCGTSYDTTITCTDNAGNGASTGITLSTNACTTHGGSSGGGGGGGTSTWKNTYNKETSDLSSGTLTIQLASNERVKVTASGATHYVGVKSISSKESTATIEVTSTPQTATMKVGETKYFDLNNNGKNDFYVKLKGIDKNKADLEIGSVVESTTPAPSTSPPPTSADIEESPAPEPVSQAPEYKVKGVNIWPIMLTILIVIVIGIIIFLVVRRKR